MRRPLGALLLTLAICLGGAPARAEPCRAFQAHAKLTLQPFVLSASEKIDLKSGDCRDDGATFAFVFADGRPAATATVSGLADRADVVFAFGARIERASYGVRTDVKAHAAELFDVTGGRLREGGAQAATTRYPFDWKDRQKTNAREADSVIPGFSAGGLNVVYDTPRLGAIVLNRSPGRIGATFPFYDDRNQAGDIGSARRTVKAGDSQDMRFYFHAGLAHIQDARFGAPDRRGMAGVTVSQFPPRLWAPAPGSMTRAALVRAPEGLHCGAADKGAGRTCFPTDDELTAFAEATPGVNDIVILRTALPRARAAAAIRAGGARPFYYLFFGAVAERNGDERVKPEWLLKDSNGKQYIAPRSVKSEGRWRFLDLTHPAARAYFVDSALEAIDAGFAGVYMDGGNFWNMPNGLVGGDNSNARMSQNHGRHLLMRELRAAIRARAPDARIGMLANRYAEYMHAADFVQREGTALHWRDKDARPHLRVMAFDPTAASAKSWQRRYGRLIQSPIFLACRGPNAVLVRSCRESLPKPYAGTYYNAGGFDIFDSALAAAVVIEPFGPGDLFVTSTEGDAELLGRGVSRLARETRGRVWFSRQVPLLALNSWRPVAETSHVYVFAAGENYIPADRSGPDGWTWAREGFLFRDGETYVAGDFYVVDSPAAPQAGSLRARLAPEPYRDVARRTARSPDAPPTDQMMTIRLRLPEGAEAAWTDAAGAPLRPKTHGTANGLTVLVIETDRPVTLTLSGLR